MHKVKLTTRDGGFVTEIQVPPLNPPYEVVVWGQRVFVWDGATQTYREGLMFVDPSTFIHRNG
jgi:hypothetical protein